mmetsp:Transcript_121465/g.288662  ORF Transcript_121465/g.288662 Transcript_121465/m.288662 type:complete len:298 (+) Transcript_121465:1530-2423(+)
MDPGQHAQQRRGLQRLPGRRHAGDRCWSHGPGQLRSHPERHLLQLGHGHCVGLWKLHGSGLQRPLLRGEEWQDGSDLMHHRRHHCRHRRRLQHLECRHHASSLRPLLPARRVCSQLLLCGHHGDRLFRWSRCGPKPQQDVQRRASSWRADLRRVEAGPICCAEAADLRQARVPRLYRLGGQLGVRARARGLLSHERRTWMLVPPRHCGGLHVHRRWSHRGPWHRLLSQPAAQDEAGFGREPPENHPLLHFALLHHRGPHCQHPAERNRLLPNRRLRLCLRSRRRALVRFGLLEEYQA